MNRKQNKIMSVTAVVAMFLFIIAKETGVKKTTARQDRRHRKVKLPISFKPSL